MQTLAEFEACVATLYDLHSSSAQIVSSTSFRDGHVIGQLLDERGETWRIHALQQEAFRTDLSAYFYPWSQGNAHRWLSSRAATLDFLAQYAFPAPRILPTREGDWLGAFDTWSFLVVSWLPGSVIIPTPPQLQQLGRQAARLHALPLPPDLAQVGKSYWYPENTLATMRHALTRVASLIPNAWQPYHTAFATVVEHFAQQDTLSIGVIHGDLWPRNALELADGTIGLIDWDTSGVGWPICDLGRCLLECHVESFPPDNDPLRWHIHPHPARVAAVMGGYLQERPLTPEEWHMLVDGIRFGIAFIDILHFLQMLVSPPASNARAEQLERRWARLQNMWSASQTIADLASNGK